MARAPPPATPPTLSGSTQSAQGRTPKRHCRPSLITKLNAEQEVAVKKAKEDQAARCMTKAKSRILKSAGRLVDDGVFQHIHWPSYSNLLMCMVMAID